MFFVASTSDKLIFAVAIASLLLYLLKIGLLFIGGSDSVDTVDVFDTDFHDAASQDSFSIFSTQSILAFLMGSTWTILSCKHSFQLSQGLSWFCGIGFGSLMMLFSAYLLAKINKLNSQSKFDINKAIGKVGQVYLPVPAKGKGFGQVELAVDGRKRIFKACSISDDVIEAFARVIVVKVENGNLLVKRS